MADGAVVDGAVEPMSAGTDTVVEGSDVVALATAAALVVLVAGAGAGRADATVRAVVAGGAVAATVVADGAGAAGAVGGGNAVVVVVVVVVGRGSTVMLPSMLGCMEHRYVNMPVTVITASKSWFG